MIASEMSTHATAGPGPAADACHHCDTSVPHEHLDVPAVIDGARRAARRGAVVMVAVAGALTAAAVVLAALVAGPGRAAGAAGLTLAGYVAVASVGVVVAGSARRRTSGSVAVLGASLTTAALTPLVALVVAAVTGPGWAVALVAATTWLLVTALAEAGRVRSWDRLLLTPGDAGERARARAVADRGSHDPTSARWAAQGVLVGAATWLLGVVAPAVVVLVPLAPAVVALAARRSLERP